MEKKLLQFLDEHLKDHPFLLALSGGPDSMALFHLLRNLKKKFHVAHVDHGWRESSQKEALELEEMCRGLDIPFHLERLVPSELLGNLEDACRKMRLNFFRQICEKEHLNGVLLAHHADDKAETVLKRVLEGAPLKKLKGLTSYTEIEGLKIFRPLLKVHKKELIQWLQDRKLVYFLDSTNEDTKYLRSRMRKQLFPLLSEHFGKGILSSLCRIGEYAEELEEFLKREIDPYRKKISLQNGYICLDFSRELPSHRFLLKAVIKDFFEMQGLSIPISTLEAVANHLEKKSIHIEMRIAKRCVKIHKETISISKMNIF